MESANMNQLIAELSRDLVSEIAPEELPLFRTASATYFQNPGRALAAQDNKDDLLGFGTGEVVTLLTPYVLAITTEVVGYLVVEIKKSAASQGSITIDEWVKKLFKRFRPRDAKDAPLPLTQAQLVQVQAIVQREGRRLKLSEPHLKLMADAVVGSLLLATP
jgi:hypothetical protein